jgi:two-component system, NarL family, sensor histidine kinase UhpB
VKSAVATLLILLSAAITHAQPGIADSLLRVVAENKRDTNQVIAYNRLGIEFSRKDMVKQRQYLYEGVTLSKKLNNFRITGFYSLLSASHQSSGAPDSAAYYIDLLEAATKKDPKDALAYENFQQSAGLYYKNAGKPRLAIPYLERTLAFTKDSTNRAGMMLNIGNVYNELSDLQTATKYHLNSLALFEKVGNKRGQSFALTSLGSDYLKMQQWNKANVYYGRSLKMKEELKDQRGILTALGGMGNVYMELGDHAAAVTAFERCYKMAKEMSITVEIGRALNELAQVHRRIGNINKAKGYYNEALAIARQQEDNAWVANIEAQLLQVDSEGKSSSQVEEGLLKTLNQYKENGDRIGIANSHHNLSEFYSKEKKFDKAYQHLRLYTSINDSTRGMSVDEQLRSLEEQYANEKRDREIELIKKDQELKTADLETRQAVQAGVILGLISVLVIVLLLVNRYQVIGKIKRRTEIEKMRNAIARDLHDDIGSTLSSINILSQIATKEHGENAIRHFNKIAEQSGRMMESMSDIVWSISPGNDSLEQVVAKMKEFAAEILEPKNITFRFTGEDSLNGTELSVDKRKNLFLIFKEAVNNAAKYSGATDLEISFVRQGNTLSLTVSDNGGGFEPENVKAGNGLKNMKDRALALKGRFDFVTHVKEGTRIALELPIT